MKFDPHRFALLSDVHVLSDRATGKDGEVMFEAMAQAVGEIAALEPRPVVSAAEAGAALRTTIWLPSVVTETPCGA